MYCFCIDIKQNKKQQQKPKPLTKMKQNKSGAQKCPSLITLNKYYLIITLNTMSLQKQRKKQSKEKI